MLRDWYDSTAGTHAGPDGYEQFVFWCEERHGVNVERAPSNLWPGFLAWWLGLDVPLVDEEPVGVEFIESLGATVAQRDPPQTSTLHCTDEELFSAIMPVLHDKMMRFAGGDAHQAEVWAAEVALGLYEALKPYLR